MAQTNQLLRTWRLVRLLSSGRWSVPDLARELCTSRRNVRRDLALLEEAGFPLTQDERYRWRVFDWRKELA